MLLQPELHYVSHQDKVLQWFLLTLKGQRQGHIPYSRKTDHLLSFFTFTCVKLPNAIASFVCCGYFSADIH